MARREALLQEVAHTVVIPVTSFSIPRTSLVRAIYDYDVVEERDSLECGEHRVPLYFLAEIETQREGERITRSRSLSIRLESWCRFWSRSLISLTPGILMALFILILRCKDAKNHRDFLHPRRRDECFNRDNCDGCKKGGWRLRTQRNIRKIVINLTLSTSQNPFQPIFQRHEIVVILQIITTYAVGPRFTDNFNNPFPPLAECT